MTNLPIIAGMPATAPLGQFAACPVLMSPQAGALASAHLARWRAGLPPADVEYCAAPGDFGAERRPYEMLGNLAVISVAGLLVAKLGWIGSSWITGYDGLKFQLSVAFADPAVAAVVLDIDSGGGVPEGCFDLVDWIRAAKAAASKPVYAVCTETAYSAAYAIACAADQISLPRTGGVGSIGVWTMHWDYSAALEKAGVAVTIVQSGARKTDGHPFAPLSDDAAGKMQKLVDDLRGLFAASVAAGRGISVDDVMATEAACFDGPEGSAEAVRLKLADVVAPADQVITALINHHN